MNLYEKFSRSVNMYAEANQDEVEAPGKINRWGPSKILFC